MGLVNSGPLATSLHRSSLQNRLDYWQAAISMFKAHPIFGVGIDRFGENYGHYAPRDQVVFGQLTDNAHNVFLQLLATGGLLVCLPYLLIVGLIFMKSIRGIRAAKGRVQIDLVGLFAIWFILLLISLISIDNLGLTIWFWISGGVLFAASQDTLGVEGDGRSTGKKRGKSRSELSTPSENFAAPLVSFALTIVALLIIIPAIRTSSAIEDMRANRSRLTPAQFLNKIEATANIWPRNSAALSSLSDIALRIDNTDLALKLASQAIEMDPKSNYGNQLSAVANERSNSYLKAIDFRLRVMELDPWNTANMLEIVRDYVALKDLPNAKLMAEKITKLRPGGPDDIAAAALIKG
jgi:tetratricopeptide (TPR) repeat protein